MSWGHAVGIYLANGRLTMTRVAGTLGGTAVVTRHQQEMDGQSASEALKDLLETQLTVRERKHLAICIGISPEQTFFSTCPEPETEPGGATSSEKLLAACGMGNMGAGGEAAVGFVSKKLRGANFCSVAACRHELAEKLSAAARKAKVEDCRLEPGPWSLLRAAKGKVPGRWRTAVCVLLGEAGGLAMLLIRGQLVLWRRFALPKGPEARSIASAVRSLQVHALQRLGVGHIDGLAIQGKITRDLADDIAAFLSLATVVISDQSLDADLYSLGLAMSARKPEDKCMDMLQALRRSPSLSKIFPRKLLAVALLLVGAMGLLLWDKSRSLEQEYQFLKQQNASYKWAQDLQTQQIEGESKMLQAEVGAVRKFLSTRIIWSDYLRDLPSRLPPNTYLSNIWALAELKEMGKRKHEKKTNKSLTIRGATRFSDRESAPKEIDAFLESLRNVEILRRDFPIVTLAEIKWKRESGTDTAMFTIIALPRKKKGPQG